MAAYYNENDRFAAAWLRELIKAGLIADGEVDERSIELVAPGDVRGFTQCHFFAGIGGWSYALRLAGWPDDRAVWTGSCPCLPWSAAGAGLEADDSRDLWPAWFQLIRQCRPIVCFGEQTAGKAGRAWLDRVYDDMEASEYAVAAVDLPACSVGAHHRRQRHWWVADTGHAHWWSHCRGGFDLARRHSVQSKGTKASGITRNGGATRGLAYANGRQSWNGDVQRSREHGQRPQDGAVVWEDAAWISCSDGASRPVEPGTFPLAYGIPARLGRLRGYGNAIVPQVAAMFIEAYMTVEKASSTPRGSHDRNG